MYSLIIINARIKLFFNNLTTQQSNSLKSTAERCLGLPYIKNGCISFVFGTLLNSLEYITIDQFPFIVQPLLTDNPPSWHVSGLLTNLLDECRVSKIKSLRRSTISNANVFIVQKNWNTRDRVKISYHMGFIFKDSEKFTILHNRQTIVLPDFIEETPGVVSHILDSTQFDLLCDLWSSERQVASYGGGTIHYSMYF